MLFEWQLTGLKDKLKVKIFSYKAQLNPFFLRKSAGNLFKLEFEQRKNRELYELNEIYEERTKYNTKEKKPNFSHNM